MENPKKLAAHTSSQQREKFTDLMQHMKLDMAANLLGCGTDELLHFGATGRLEIIAPIVAAGEFSWPPDIMLSGLIEFDEPVVRWFDASSRIILFPSDVAKIEAIGWTIPWRFYSPAHAQESIEQSARSFEDSLTARHEKRGRADSGFLERFPNLGKNFVESEKTANVDGDSYSVARPGSLEFDREGIEYLRETALDLPWTITGPFDQNSDQTKVEHLFISRQEFLRLRDGTPQKKISPKEDVSSPPPENTGSASFNYKNRFEILFAAIWLNRVDIEKAVGNRMAWSKSVELGMEEVWPSAMNLANKPPAPRTIEDLLGEALSDTGLERQKCFRKK